MSPFTRVYYALKPFLPRHLRLLLRRIYASRVRRKASFTWPILESAGRKPEGWPGWPDGKQFAFVLTHDVESAAGVAKVRQLAELEMSLGFRSSFNFIPEGEYRVPDDLRHWLVAHGFEVGVHDHRHDGRLYSSRESFLKSATRINHYLEQWGAVGFRAGFMLRNLEWLHDLNVAYDASTFDTDPFEPQPDGAGTIFPFWVPRGASIGPDSRSQKPANSSSPALQHSSTPTGSGYIELPYTLVQDSTLFFLLGENSNWLWKRKLDWICRHGGMALLNVHPDYVDFHGPGRFLGEFPVEHYRDFLVHVREHFADRYWHALPSAVSQFAREHRHALTPHPGPVDPPATPAGSRVLRRIWIDLENTPHIPFFRPIIRELESRGYQIVLSARDAYQTCEMASQFGFAYDRIGHHYGRNRWLKLWGLFVRSAQLLSFVRRERPCLALNHGSRTQTLISNLLGIPTVTIMDYEHTGQVPFLSSRWSIMPEVVVSQVPAAIRRPSLLSYTGIKEDVYVPDFTPDPRIFAQLGLGREDIVVTVRPPATEAHYHNAEAEILFERFVERAFRASGVRVVILPRNKRQEAEIRARWPHWFGADRKVFIPDGVVNGLNLLWASDLVVSGGGTMNREAAAMGVPVYSIFRGTIGAVDHQLQSEGRMILIEKPGDVDSKIEIKRRVKDAGTRYAPRQALADIVNHIETILKSYL